MRDGSRILSYLTCVFCIASGCFLTSENITFTDYKIVSSLVKGLHEAKRSKGSCGILKIPINGTIKRFCVLPYALSTSGIFTPNALITVSGNKDIIFSPTDFNVTLANGYLMGNAKTRSSLKGFIHQNAFYGRISIGEKVYHIESIDKFPDIGRKTEDREKISVMYEESFPWDLRIDNILEEIVASKTKNPTDFYRLFYFERQVSSISKLSVNNTSDHSVRDDVTETEKELNLSGKSEPSLEEKVPGDLKSIVKNPIMDALSKNIFTMTDEETSNIHNSSMSGNEKHYRDLLLKTNNVFDYLETSENSQTTLNVGHDFFATTPFSSNDSTKQSHRNFINFFFKSTGSGSLKSQKRPIKRKPPNERICELLLLADYDFYATTHNLELTILEMIHALNHANFIFRSSDFNRDGIPDNIGFKIKHAVVITSRISETNKFTDMFISEKTVSGKEFLNAFSSYTPLKDVCLGIAFTGIAFRDFALGISYTALGRQLPPMSQVAGGICDTPSIADLSFNTLAVSIRRMDGRRVPKSILSLSVAHELGHSFGSQHDNPNVDFCSGYLMAALTHDGSHPNHHAFSVCSLKQIDEVVKQKGYCMVTTHEPFCGNGLVEQDEECDCGSPIQCALRDPCCNPPGIDGCKVNVETGFRCHPSQGLCCKETCEFRDLSTIGVDCRKKPGTCPCKRDLFCRCGHRGICVADECHSIECVRLGLRECVCQTLRDYNGEYPCSTCCLDQNGRCFPAMNITDEWYATETLDQVLLKEFGSFYNISRKLRSNTRRRYYVFENENFLNVDFRVYPGRFCIALDEIGVCKSGKCIIKFPITSRGPSEETVRRFLGLASSGTPFRRVVYIPLLYIILFLNC